MTLRRRLALVAAVAVAVAIALASGIVYLVVRGELRGRLDDELRAAGGPAAMARLPGVAHLRGLPEGGGVGGPPATRDDAAPDAPAPATPAGPAGGVQLMLERRLAAPKDALGLETAYVALVGADGRRIWPPPGAERAELPVTAATRAVADGRRGAFFSDATIDDTPVRVYTTSPTRAAGYALQVARPLTDIDSTLDRLALVLLLVSAGGIALAAALGRVVARTALRPVGQLTSAVEHVGETGDLTRRIDVGGAAAAAGTGAAGGAGGAAAAGGAGAAGGDEIARLARSFNAMLAALEASVGRQRQLVADASHELRTPLTSLRTNIEVLALPTALPDAERRRLLADVVEQLDELGGLVGDLVELARDEEQAVAVEDVRLDQLVAEAVERARRRPDAPSFAVALAPCLVRGVPARLDRAVANLLDNAAKWSPDGGEVMVELAAGASSGDAVLTVRDRGPGIAASDLPHVFERFYRAPGARGLPGSGLGLAIVKQAAESHGGSVRAEAADGGGALLRLALPAEPLATPPRSAPPAASPPRSRVAATSGVQGAGGGTSTRAG